MNQFASLHMTPHRNVRALLMLSGGLDSQLAICVLRDQGIDVHAITFDSPFFNPEIAKKAARALDVTLHIVDFTMDILELLQNPPHGFGSCLNPCVDCHARMMRRCGEMLDEFDAQFIATGEVLSQRPMSQNRQSLLVVAKDSGYADIVLRPLSAKLLDPTLPEREGWVDRDKLLALSGRGRRPQIALAAHFGLTDYPSPAGGCRLTEPNFTKRLRDLMDHEGLVGVQAIKLLRYGRHFRLESNVKLIVGRHAADNAVLEGTAELYDLILNIEDIPGPVGILPYTASEAHVRQSAAICARYSDAKPGETVSIRVRSSRGMRRIKVLPEKPEIIEPLRV